MDRKKGSLAIFLILSIFQIQCSISKPATLILVSAESEWNSVKKILNIDSKVILHSPYGEYFSYTLKNKSGDDKTILFLQGGWGKIDSAASTQWAITKFSPASVINLGTAGGFIGKIKEGEILYVNRTIVYDIIERMGDSEEAIRDYTTDIKSSQDLAKSNQIAGLKSGAILSADQDIDPKHLQFLMNKYHALAGDWESGSIARICSKNQVPIIILRGITDVVDPNRGSRTYGNLPDFQKQTEMIMTKELNLLSEFL
ncbi:hypothetical protein LPTSP3_g02900 [Leptospira kobayashii]|uniref:Nucleoside phosphorylase domain-containing protein n=1 Tax=Leptospira kobayashii TaxID=1917830 RepID=A0ABM7UFY9_9LEPT|nr:5'-methylthioadenosine/S-adenosylhomocysteine nucleosidase [Leptospira kobayashii]BDA77360.1 hypothetical protein LPTSP3_g02900 [Leptospira kobayashii]